MFFSLKTNFIPLADVQYDAPHSVRRNGLPFSELWRRPLALPWPWPNRTGSLDALAASRGEHLSAAEFRQLGFVAGVVAAGVCRLSFRHKLATCRRLSVEIQT